MLWGFMPLLGIMHPGLFTTSLFAEYVKFCANVGFENRKQDLNFQGKLIMQDFKTKICMVCLLIKKKKKKKNFWRRDLKVGTNIKELWK